MISSRGEERFLGGILVLCFYLHNNPGIKHKVPLLSGVGEIVSTEMKSLVGI